MQTAAAESAGAVPSAAAAPGPAAPAAAGSASAAAAGAAFPLLGRTAHVIGLGKVLVLSAPITEPGREFKGRCLVEVLGEDGRPTGRTRHVFPRQLKPLRQVSSLRRLQGGLYCVSTLSLYAACKRAAVRVPERVGQLRPQHHVSERRQSSCVPCAAGVYPYPRAHSAAWAPQGGTSSKQPKLGSKPFRAGRALCLSCVCGVCICRGRPRSRSSHNLQPYQPHHSARACPPTHRTRCLPGCWWSRRRATTGKLPLPTPTLMISSWRWVFQPPMECLYSDGCKGTA